MASLPHLERAACPLLAGKRVRFWAYRQPLFRTVLAFTGSMFPHSLGMSEPSAHATLIAECEEAFQRTPRQPRCTKNESSLRSPSSAGEGVIWSAVAPLLEPLLRETVQQCFPFRGSLRQKHRRAKNRRLVAPKQESWCSIYDEVPLRRRRQSLPTHVAAFLPVTPTGFTRTVLVPWYCSTCTHRGAGGTDRAIYGCLALDVPCTERGEEEEGGGGVVWCGSVCEGKFNTG